MALNFNTSPYHDDFDEAKQYYRILFRPGRAVQARELTQLQTVLQNQIARFGQNVFKEGALVIPGLSSIDTYANYVKLTSSYNSISSDTVLADLVGVEITGQTSGVKALVIDYAVSVDSDPPTLYIKYLNSGTSKTSTFFFNDEVLTSADGSVSVKSITSSSVGQGIRFAIQAGVIFVKGVFAYFDQQSILVSKYDRITSKIIGFSVVESILTSDEDEGLLDPAAGAFNYFAPGADRYKISLNLEAISFADLGTGSDFVELARIENGNIISTKKTVDYNILGDTLARRTFDESGNYTVRPYGLELINHLRTSNADLRDGLLTAEEGGNTNLMVGIIHPGKSYVMGYELENLKTQYIPISKSREYVSVNQGTIPTEIGNYVLITNLYSAPDISTHSTVSLYNRFTTSNGNSSGTLVGTARPRALEYYSGSDSTTVYKLYLFDIQMLSPYKFERDVKQIYFNNSGFTDFTANISPRLITLTGTVSTTNGSATVNGSGTRFSTELSTNNFISINGNVSEVINIVSDYQLTLLNNAVGNISGFSGYRIDSNIALPNKSAYLFELPYQAIKTVDPTNVETVYYTRRVYDRTLSGGNVIITAGTNEVFTPYSADDYIGINKTTGSLLPLAGNVTLGGSPSGKTITITLGYSGASFLSDDVRVFTTVAKSNNAADKKVKTLNSTYVDFSSNTDATYTLNLAQADVYKVSNVLMSSNAFGNAFLIAEASDITSRYIFDNGQRKTHYDLGKLLLKPGAAKPTGPVRVYFQYFSHSAGDYCTVDSYTDIDYEKIPVFNDGTKIYQLRDCIDFRPVIDSNGTTFTSPTETLNQSVYFTTDYEYYLGKVDKIVLDSSGIIKSVSGPSSLNPVEPATPDNTMALFVIKQQPYVYDIKKDVEINVIDNRRYTMRDIGRIENRVKNLEYYTELSLLELQAKSFTIKDGQGLDRFKNGFIVDNFTGHNVGDPKNPDYSVSMDFTAGEIRPLFVQINLPLSEVTLTNSGRTTKNYAVTGNIASLPYELEPYITSNVSSRVENVNPFNVIDLIGSVDLNPPADVWFENEKLPDIYSDQEQTLSTLKYDSAARGTFNTVWNNWEIAWVGGRRVEQRTGTTYATYEKINTTTNEDIVVSKVLIPKMRSKSIRFHAAGLKPNTRVHAFFDGYKVTNFCTGDYSSTGTLLSDISIAERSNDIFLAYTLNFGNLFTDVNGTISGTFNYDSNFLNLNAGNKIFRLTDSPVNGADSTTSAEAIFVSSGERRQVRNEVVSTRYTYSTQEATYDSRLLADPPVEPIETRPVVPPFIESTISAPVGSITGGTSETVTPSVAPNYPPYNTFARDYCDYATHTLYYVYHDGAGGTFEVVAESNSPTCGYVAQEQPESIVIVQTYIPSIDIVNDALIGSGYTDGNYRYDVSGVNSLASLPSSATYVRQMTEDAKAVQVNLQAATTDVTDGTTLTTRAAGYFYSDGRVDANKFFSGIKDGSWATGLSSDTLTEVTTATTSLTNQMVNVLKSSDGTLKTPAPGSIAGGLFQSLKDGDTNLTQFLPANPTEQDYISVSISGAAMLTTAAALASQSASVDPNVPWNSVGDNLVVGQSIGFKP